MSLLLAAVAVAVAAPAAATRTHPASLSLSLFLPWVHILPFSAVCFKFSLSFYAFFPSFIDRSIDRSFYLASFFVFSFLCLPISAVATCYSC